MRVHQPYVTIHICKRCRSAFLPDEEHTCGDTSSQGTPMTTRICQRCGDILMANEEHTQQACDYWAEENVSMAPMLSKVITQAVAYALVDSVHVPEPDGHGNPDRPPNPHERVRWRANPYEIPREAMAAIDPMALAQNVTARLIGRGNTYVRGVYGGNASPRDVFEASFPEADRNHAIETAFALLDGFAAQGVEVDGISLDPTEIQRAVEEDE